MPRSAALALTVAGSGLAVIGTAAPADAVPALPVVATGGYHSCALMPDQTGVVQIVVSDELSCALQATGDVWC